MKQLLIVKSDKALNATGATPYDLSGLEAGAITFFELGGSSALSAAPTKNFGIALGRPNGQLPFVIPEVDINTLEITKALPTLGKAFKRKFTFPTPVVGKEYTILFVKKGTVPHERNTWHCSIIAGTTTDTTEAAALKKAIEDKMGDIFTVTQGTSTDANKLTITCKTVGEQWEAKFADALTGTSWAGSTDFVDAIPTVGDKKFIQDLASQCAAGKGFTDTEQAGRDVIPGYPENVEDLVVNNSGSNGASTAGYALYTLRFQVGRDSAKTRDEKVWQLVHIALPITNSSYSDINGILPEGKFSKNAAAAIAADTVTTMVKSTSLN